MRLFLLRHGEAGFDSTTDFDRQLTTNGRIRLQACLERNQSLIQQIERIVHSPYLRTTETADMVAGIVPVTQEPLDLLTPESVPQDVINWLSEQADSSLLLVTHQPLIGNLVSLLCEGDLSRPAPMLPGSLAIIELEYPAAGLGQLLAQPN